MNPLLVTSLAMILKGFQILFVVAICGRLIWVLWISGKDVWSWWMSLRG